jgi:hypothetical protein
MDAERVPCMAPPCSSSRKPFKFHKAQCHHIPKTRYHVRNWPHDDCSLVQRGDIRVGLSEDAISCSRVASRTTPDLTVAVSAARLHPADSRAPWLRYPPTAFTMN